MFLLQSINKNILYTGDFRISSSRFENYKILTQLTIHEVYLDSTFLSEAYSHFPTQVESVRAICVEINRWLNKHSNNKVFIKAPAQYSLEFLLMNIARKCKEKVYVSGQQQEKYIYFKELDEAISHNERSSRIFLEMIDRVKTVRFDKTAMILKPSALYWKNLKKGESFLKVDKDSNITRIAYSSHSSFTELKDFLQFLKPLKVFLNVSNTETMRTLGQVWQSNDNIDNDDDISEKLEKFNKRLNLMLREDCELLPKRIKL